MIHSDWHHAICAHTAKIGRCAVDFVDCSDEYTATLRSDNGSPNIVQQAIVSARERMEIYVTVHCCRKSQFSLVCIMRAAAQFGRVVYARWNNCFLFGGCQCDEIECCTCSTQQLQAKFHSIAPDPDTHNGKMEQSPYEYMSEMCNFCRVRVTAPWCLGTISNSRKRKTVRSMVGGSFESADCAAQCRPRLAHFTAINVEGIAILVGRNKQMEWNQNGTEQCRKYILLNEMADTLCANCVYARARAYPESSCTLYRWLAALQWKKNQSIHFNWINFKIDRLAFLRNQFFVCLLSGALESH